MGFDIIYLLVLVFAAWSGFRKGLIVGIFSLIAIIIGLAAAIKLSVIASEHIGAVIRIDERWLPVVSFIAVFVVVILLVRLGAKAIEKAVQWALLGWVNRLGGILLYAVLYTIVFSVVIFYAEQLRLIDPQEMEGSLTYSFVRAWGPKVIDGFGAAVPWFSQMFNELKDFFGSVGNGQK